MFNAPVVEFSPVSTKLSEPTFVILPAPEMTPDIRTPLIELIVMFAELKVEPLRLNLEAKAL